MRELVGYYRYDTAVELDLLNQIWALDDAFGKYFPPSLKLKSKHRDRAKVIKTYHPAATPHQRALTHPATRKQPINTMNARYKKLRLGALQRHILDLTDQLETLAQAKGRTHHPSAPRPTEPKKPHEATTRPTRKSSPEATTNPTGGIDMRHYGLSRLVV